MTRQFRANIHIMDFASVTDKYVCFLGMSGIGKSSLINALLADRDNVVPAGGIGPCTAQAIRVRYGGYPSFKAVYHSKEYIVQLLSVLIDIYEQQGCNKTRWNFSKDLTNKIQRIQKAKLRNANSEIEIKTYIWNNCISQTCFLITGRQRAQLEITYLIDSISLILNEMAPFSSQFEISDLNRIEIIRECLEKRSFNYKCYDIQKYHQYLSDHAVGHLAPLIQYFDMYVNADLLKRGIVFVDLPGVGIDGDIHQKITKEYISKAKLVILVVSPRGIGSAEHNLMKSVDIYRKLIPIDRVNANKPLKLIIAVTRVDDIASSRFRQNKSKEKWQHWDETCLDIEVHVRRQLIELLSAAYSINGEVRAQRNVEKVSELISIVPVSAVEFRKIVADDNYDRSFITEEKQSNIPRLRDMLCRLFEGYI